MLHFSLARMWTFAASNTAEHNTATHWMLSTVQIKDSTTVCD
jgi:hypothetical protein